jgi:hypothetical protein
MSRAYRIEVREAGRRTVRASDEIATRIDLLDILPPEETADLLRGELKTRGFAERDDGTLVRKDGATTITVDPCGGEVVLKTETEVDRDLEVKKTGHAIDDIKGSGEAVRERLKEQAAEELDGKAERARKELQADVSNELERAVRDVQPELAEIVNRVTRQALKTKAARLGRVQSVSENESTGDLTITVEV